MLTPISSPEFATIYPHLIFVQGSPPAGQPRHVYLDPLGHDGTVPFYPVCQLTRQVCGTNGISFKSLNENPLTIVETSSMESTPQFPKNCADCPTLRQTEDPRYSELPNGTGPLSAEDEID